MGFCSAKMGARRNNLLPEINFDLHSIYFSYLQSTAALIFKNAPSIKRYNIGSCMVF